MTGMDLWIGVCPSVCSSFWQYCWNRLISFFQNFTWCFRGPYLDVRDRNQSFLKTSASGRNYQKWPKNSVFQLLRDINSLVLSGNGVKWKYLQSFNILQKLHVYENLIPKLRPKMLSTRQISVFFNRQYLIIGLTSYFDFLNVDGREGKEQGLLMGFSKKNTFGSNRLFCAGKRFFLGTLRLR